MPLYDGRKFAQEGLLKVAQHCAQAALHAPQLIGKTEIKMEIVAGEELENYFSVQDAANKLGARLTGETYKLAYRMGEPPVLLLIGADVTPIVEAPCRTACPAGIDVPRYIRLIGDGKYDQAVQVVREKVPFPSVCAYVCHAPCEKKCRRGTLRDDPIAIEALKRFAVDHAEETDSGDPSTKATGKRVAIIGSGPAGLTAAYYLRKVCGHAVTVFEALSQPGGMMRVGIPRYRLPRELLDKEIAAIKTLGVEIKLNSRQKSLDKLLQQGYEAIFVSVGAHRDITLGVSGEDLPGVIECLSFLRDVNLGKKAKVGPRVAVVGGGNAAMDAARTALRLGAKETSILYRRTRADMPAYSGNVEQALREGVKIECQTAVSKIESGKNGLQVECVRTELRPADADGRRLPVSVEGSEFRIRVDTVIVATGQSPEVPSEFGLSLGKENTIQVDPDTHATDREGVFAGGDAVTGPASVIEAIAAGRRAASWIDQYLGSLGIIDEVLAPPEQVPEVSPAQEALGRVDGNPEKPQIQLLTVEQALASFDEVELGLSEQEALVETTRCLKCDQVGFDCGACGFKTCREAVINCQNRFNETGGEPWGWLMKGPSCIWRAMELGISIDWAAAAAHTLNVESRVGMIPATAFLRMGYMEGCTLVTVVPIGPCKERWYFSPGSGREDYRPAEMERRGQILQYPPLWMRFTGPGRDLGRRGINVKDRWWEPPYTRLEIVEDDDWGNSVLDRDYAIFAAADEIRKKRKLRRLNLPKIKEILDGKKKR
ncbi:MAG: FAD-dependent oxidoreductase [Desulfobacterales bacterium]|nr:FAD-dependent oxidoreductase [Desulfobacterales bacterium]